MSISHLIHIDTHYTRSINLERDARSAVTVDSYIPTPRAKQALERIGDALRDGESQRAWALTGPYGSGKSIFAIFCAHLLGDPSEETTQTALGVLDEEPELAKVFRDHAKAGKGFCPVLITGAPEPLGSRYLNALADSAERYWSNRRGRLPRIVTELKELADGSAEIGISQLVSLTSQLQNAVANSGGHGLLVVFDELGKFLEYEARHYGANDIYLLQALAEHAYAGGKGKLLLMALLHQAFDQYARGLGDKLRNEWAKVQGRYESIPFLEPAEQVMRVAALAFEPKLQNADKKQIEKAVKAFIVSAAKDKCLPGGLDEKDAEKLFARCYPLHPLALMLLPVLCQKVAQNERTLFSYLGSQEPHGLRQSIERLTAVGEWVYPAEVYDYFIQNQSSSIFDHVTHRRWAEVVTALDRLGDASEDEVCLVKTIGLLNIIGAHGALKASKGLLSHCLPTPERVQEALAVLEAKAIIQFRHYSGEYRVWQGSDFDLEGALEDARNQVGRIELAESLNKRRAVPPVIARRHSIQSGTVRFFQPVFVDSDSYQNQESHVQSPRIVFYLSEGEEVGSPLEQTVARHFPGHDLVAICPIGARLREAVTDVIALVRVRSERQELNSDPVASREVKDSLAAAQRIEEQLVDSLLEHPEDCRWYWGGKLQEIGGKRDLQQCLSAVMGELYHASPVVKNELINRDKISSQAAAARNKLLNALLSNADQEDLGIEKYPPEKAIYRSLFLATGMHGQDADGSWRLSPPSADDPYRFSPVWKRIDEFYSESESTPTSFDDLGKALTAPPFGLKQGVLPVLYIASYLTRQHEVALYEERGYIPYLTEDLLERFVRRPEAFQVQLFRITGMRASIYQEYGKALWGTAEHGRSILAIAKPLMQFMQDLPLYVQTTKRLSDVTLKVRKAFQLKKSPEEMLFELLPAACGYPPLDPDDDTQGERLSDFAVALTEALRELKGALPALLEEQHRLLANAFKLNKDSDLESMRATLRARSEGLENFTVDTDGLRAFIMRLINRKGSDAEWLNGLLLFLGRKPVEKWTDADRTNAEYRLSEFSGRWRDLEMLRVQYDRNAPKKDGDFEVALLRMVRQGVGEQDRVVVVTPGAKQATAAATEQLAKVLGELDEELRIVALAEVLNGELFSDDLCGDILDPTEKPHVKKTGKKSS
ncbi:MAG: hypothetical protein HQL52_12860 [Magnetococcales bacterium]|nr:hypothetical protein [Magnetococcales bacterium]